MQYHNSQHLTPVIRPPYHKFGDREEATLFPDVQCPSPEIVVSLSCRQTVHEIQLEECQKGGITLGQMLSDSRYTRIVRPRMIAMARLKDELDMKYEEIGRVFNRDRTTVFSAYKKHGKNV